MSFRSDPVPTCPVGISRARCSRGASRTHPRTLGSVIARTLLLGTLLALPGCVINRGSVGYTCDNPDRDHFDLNGRPDPCHLRDAADAGIGAECSEGEYVHVPVQWAGPTLLWLGPENQAPECPYGPITTDYEGHADLVAPNACEACTCEPPTGSCELPSTLTVSTTACNIPGGSTTSFDAPAPWDGHCDGTVQTAPGAAHSLTIGALAMIENGCAPGPPVAAKVVSSHWETYARACAGIWGPGPTSQSICIPNEEPTPADFRLCVVHEGNVDCPTTTGNVFVERHLFYDGIKDERVCSACACGPPTGSLCTATISIYKGADLTCSGPAFAQIPVSSENPTCIDINPFGQALGSKSAGPTSYLPGTCPAIDAALTGSLSQVGPSTFCCRL